MATQEGMKVKSESEVAQSSLPPCVCVCVCLAVRIVCLFMEEGVCVSALLYLVRNLILAPQLEKTHEMPPSSRDEGLLFLPDLESNPESSLQTEEEARHP